MGMPLGRSSWEGARLASHLLMLLEKGWMLLLSLQGPCRRLPDVSPALHTMLLQYTPRNGQRLVN